METELRHLRERNRDYPKDTDDRAKKLYPCHMRRVKQGSDETLFAEAFWGDISRGSHGQVRGMIDLFKLIMGLGHIVRENAAEIYENPKKFPRRAASAFVYLIHGPITAFNIAIAFAAAFLFFFQWQYGRVDWAGSAAITSTALAMLLGWSWLKDVHQSYLFQIFRNWIGIAAVSLGVLVVLSHGLDTFFDAPTKRSFSTWFGSRCDAGLAFSKCYDFWYAAVLYAFLAIFWGFCVTIVVLTGISETIRCLTKGPKATKALYPQTLTLMLTIWMILVVTLWVAVSQSVVKAATQFELDTVNIAVLERGMLPAINFIYYVSIALGVIALCTVAAWVDRKILTHRFGTTKHEGQAIRRLIVHPFIILGLTLAIAIVAYGAWRTTEVHFSIVAVEGRIAGLDLPEVIKGEIIKLKVSGYNIPQKFVAFLVVIASLLVVSYTYFGKYLAMGIGVAKDIVVYFVQRPTACAPERATPEEEEARNDHPFRNRIQDRLVDTLILLVKSEQPDKVVIVSHSQVTVISVEALRGGRLRRKMQAAGIQPFDIDLVTMGSPTSHLYGYYFSREFDWHSKDARNDVENGINSWLNIYRLDDFVGTTVEGPRPDFPINAWVPAKGHTNYWTDDSVLRHLRKHSFPEF